MCFLGGSHIPEALGLEAQQMGIETWLGYGATGVLLKRSRSQSILVIRLVLPRPTPVKNWRSTYLYWRQYARFWLLLSGWGGSLVDENGWFDSKDLGEWDGEQVSIIGRADNQFISGGENIHTVRKLNEHWISYLQSNQAFIVPIEDDEFGFRPVARIVRIYQPKEWFGWAIKWPSGTVQFPVEYYRMPHQEQLGIKVSRAGLAQWLQQLRSK